MPRWNVQEKIRQEPRCDPHARFIRHMKPVRSPLAKAPTKAPAARAEKVMPKTGSGNGAGEKQSRAGGFVELQRQKTLLKTGALQDAIFNSANFSSIATDEKGVIQLFNVGAERMLGYTAFEVVDKITPADISDPREVITRAEPLRVELSRSLTPAYDAMVF